MLGIMPPLRLAPAPESARMNARTRDSWLFVAGLIAYPVISYLARFLICHADSGQAGSQQEVPKPGSVRKVGRQK
jgi:hypothetical protein